MRSTLSKITTQLPAFKSLPEEQNLTHTDILNFAVNNDGNYYPRLTASFSDPKTPLNAVNDGNIWYTKSPPNCWTTFGSPNAADWLEVDLGMPRRVRQVKLYFLDDGTEIAAPVRYELQTWEAGAWVALPETSRIPASPTGHRANVVSFAPRNVQKLRVVFTQATTGKTGLSEIEVWGDRQGIYTAAPPPPGNLALNQKGEGFPKASASFHDIYGGLPKWANDGRINYRPTPVNRWTSYGSKAPTDWLEIDFGTPKEVGRVELAIYDDHGGVQPPASYTIQYFVDGEWREANNRVKIPTMPVGSAVNRVTFTHVTTQKVRVIFTHKGDARSGVTEMEIWKE